jgi:hypothetical protein
MGAANLREILFAGIDDGEAGKNAADGTGEVKA